MTVQAAPNAALPHGRDASSNAAGSTSDRSFNWAVAFMVSGALMAIAWTIAVATTQRSPGFEIVRTATSTANKGTPHGLAVGEVPAALATAQPALVEGALIARIRGTDSSGRAIVVEASPLLFRETPEPLRTHAEVRAFKALENTLHSMANGPVMLEFTDGSLAQVTLGARGFDGLNGYFWAPLLAGLLAYSLGCAMLLVVRRDRYAAIYFLAVCGYTATAWSRAWYGSRDWGLPAWQWDVALALNHTGGQLMLACGLIFVWMLPRPIGPTRWLRVMVLAVALVWALDCLRTIDPRHLTHQWPLVLWQTMIAVLAVINVRQGGFDLTARAASKWFLLMAGGALLVIVGMVLSLILGIPVPHYGQVVTIIAALPFIAMAAFIARSQLFRLESWWWRVWLWLFSGALVLVVDVLLISYLHTSTPLALALSLAVVGWVYFPLRQWLLEKLSLRNKRRLEDHVLSLLELSALKRGSAEAAALWLRILDQAFAPQEVEALGPVAEAAIEQSGMALHVPGLDGTGVSLRGAGRGSRLFSSDDLGLANTLTRLARHAASIETAYHQGAQKERQRIAADLHDDIGGKLLHLANAPGHDGQYARNALEDLRTITRGLSSSTRALEDLVADLRYQLALRCERAQVQFDWESDLGASAGAAVGAREGSVLTSICGELTRNALQQERVTLVNFTFNITQGEATLACVSDGPVTDPATWQAGLGTTSIRRRVNDLGGHCEWISQAMGGVRFVARWPVAAWLEGDSLELGGSQAWAP